MMQTMKLIGGALAVGLALSAQAATNDGLLLYCAFDGSATATYARGSGAATSAVPPEFQPGVRGQALVIGGATNAGQRIVAGLPASNQQANNCYYASDKNFDVEKGSISFWLKPVDWDGKTAGFNVFFRTGIGPNYFMLYKYWNNDQFLFLRGDSDKGWTMAENKIRGWKSGQWHHVVATWSPAEMRFFIDGAMVCARRIRFPLENPTPVEPLSVGPGGSWGKAFTGRSLVDEFRIHDRPLSADDVVRLYRQDSAAVEIEAGILTVGEKTPALDGRIEDFEYAWTAPGFSPKSSTRPQGRYGLSYDRSNLYVTVQSEIDQSRAAQPAARDGDCSSSERVELFLIPKDESKTLYHFACLPNGGIYDAKNDDKRWNADNVRITNAISSNIWTFEAAIPFADLGGQGAPDGQSWRINIVRVFTTPGETNSLAPVKGGLDDRSQFITLVFRPDAPLIRNASWSDQVKKQSASDISVQSKNERSDIRYVSISDTTKDYGLRTFSVPLFAKGKSTPYKSPVWQTGYPPDFSLSESRIVETLDGKETTLYLKKSIYEDQAPMKTFFLYTQAKQRLFVSAQRRAEGSIQARFLRPDGTCAFQASQAIPADSTYFNALFDLDFDKLVPGDYTVKIDYVAPDGKATETWEQAYRIPKKDDPMFLPYVDEDADKVPAPWTPLKIVNAKVEMWGRAYDFSKGFLFSALVSQGKEILAGPAALRLNGETLVPAEPVALKQVSGSDMLAEWVKSADLGKLKVESRIKTHFDGYCEIAMTLAPAGMTQTVATLSLDIPLRGEAATLVRDNRMSPLEGGKSGAVGAYWCQDLFYSSGSFIWVGNDRVGFNWLASNLDGWHRKNPAKSVEIIRTNDTAMLRFNLVDTPLNLDAPRTITFGFTLTPSRPLDRKILRMRNHKDLQMWCQPWQYFSYPDYDAADRQAIEGAVTQYGLNAKEVFLYLSSGITSPFCPEWPWWEEEWRSLRGGARTYGEWTGDVNDPKIRGAFCYVEAGGDTFNNFKQHKQHAFFERAKTPLTPQARNYYFDDGACVSAAYRKQALDVYRMIRRTGPDAKIWGHQGWLRVMPTTHFADIICGGEGVVVNNDGGYFKLFTPEFFRASFSPYIWGMKMVFLLQDYFVPERKLNFSMKNPEDRRSIMHAYGYCLVHDVDIYNETSLCGQLIREAMQPIWAAQDKLGWDENVIFHPYWEQDAVKLASPQSNRIMASAYTKDGKMLLAVLNDTDKEEAVKLNLDLTKLGMKEGLQGSDIWQPEATCTLSSSWEGKMPPRAFRLVVWPNSAN